MSLLPEPLGHSTDPTAKRFIAVAHAFAPSYCGGYCGRSFLYSGPGCGGWCGVGASARPPDSGENSGGGRGPGDLQWSLTFGPKLPHSGHRYCSPSASSSNWPMIVDSFSI